jgi:phosphatidylglycerol:prolipoprotein diacylglycerol transferase
MRVQRIPFAKFLDGAAPALSLSEAVSRLGCFCAGCCYGVPWNGPWSVVFPQGSFAVADMQAQGLLDASATASPPLHPVQLYNVAIMLVVTAYLLWRFPRRAFIGELFYVFLISYGAMRLVVAPFRVEVLASMKMFSVLFIVSGAFGLAMGRSSRLGMARAGVTP